MEMISSDFKGQTAVITGGARVILWDLDLDLAQETAKALGGVAWRGVAVRASVEDCQSVSQALGTTLAASDRIDILVNSAGVAKPKAPLADYDVEEFRQIVGINRLGTFHVKRAVVPQMRVQGYGRIVNIASAAWKEGNPNASAYSA